jgi:nicotinamidase-related amidase
MDSIVLALSLQRSYFNPDGTRYLGERADILKIRLLDFFNSLPSDKVVYFTREIHQTNDSFYQSIKSHALVGSPDVEIVEAFKRFPKFMVNTTRYSAFYMTPLDSELRKYAPKTVILVGVETHTNILFTAEELRNRGYEVIVPEALVAAEDDYMHAAGINIMSNALSVQVD